MPRRAGVIGGARGSAGGGARGAIDEGRDGCEGAGGTAVADDEGESDGEEVEEAGGGEGPRNRSRTGRGLPAAFVDHAVLLWSSRAPARTVGGKSGRLGVARSDEAAASRARPGPANMVHRGAHRVPGELWQVAALVRGGVVVWREALKASTASSPTPAQTPLSTALARRLSSLSRGRPLSAAFSHRSAVDCCTKTPERGLQLHGKRISSSSSSSAGPAASSPRRGPAPTGWASPT